MAVDPLDHQFVTSPLTALWKPIMPRMAVQRWVQSQPESVEQTVSGTEVSVAPGAPASWPTALSSNL